MTKGISQIRLVLFIWREGVVCGNMMWEAYMDFFNESVMGCMQALAGFYFLTGFLKKKVKVGYYLLFALCWLFAMQVTPGGSMAEFAVYILLLSLGGIFLCHAERVSVILYSSLTIVIMQLSFGIVNALLGILYPLMQPFDQRLIGIVFMAAGYLALPVAAFCYRTLCRHFSCYATEKRQYVLMVLTPVLMLFLMGEYSKSVISAYADVGNGYVYAGQVLVIQLLGMASLFCMLFAYKKLQENFRLNTELSLLAWEEHFLNQYVQEAKARYEKTKSFRHDIKNHMTVLKELLCSGNAEQASDYLGDMKERMEEMFFPCNTNHPVVDILLGNKLGIAASMGMETDCSLLLPYPCTVRDIDFCIILSNALDNAIHACVKMEAGEEKYIHVKGRIQGDFILLEIENSYQGSELPVRGTGLANIKAVTEKYHGAVHVTAGDRKFLLSVLLIIPR